MNLEQQSELANRPQQSERSFKDVCFLSSLLFRWSIIDNNRLASLLCSPDGIRILYPYELLEIRLDEDDCSEEYCHGKPLYICTGPISTLYNYIENVKDVWVERCCNIVFALKDVETFESIYTYLTAPHAWGSRSGQQCAVENQGVQIIELQSHLAAANEKIAELEKELAAAKEAQPTAKDETAETGTVDSARWRASTAAVCQAIIEVVRSGRTDWVKEANNGTDRDSAGDETFTALASRKYKGAISVMQEAENAAWQVLSDNNLTWKGGRKPSKQNSVNPTVVEGEEL